LGDITLRALSVLRGVTYILCEDARVTGKLLQAYQISTSLKPYHTHNHRQMIPKILKDLSQNASLALVSDAGMPLISDPGAPLVEACYESNFSVTVVPGPSAPLTALALSNLPAQPFYFFGFLPRGSSAQQKALAPLAKLEATLIFFERAARLPETLQAIHEALGDRPLVIARELTKKFETVYRTTLERWTEVLKPEDLRGEVTFLVGGHMAGMEDLDQEVDQLLRGYLPKHSLKTATEIVHALTQVSKKKIYAKALEFPKK
jgi:16S rRNA (cytidine1402-2'-O)-methyltransferase